MQKICLISVLASLFAFQSASAVDLDNGVLVLTDANFDEELAKHELLLVEFYAPWCGHCKKLAPEYEGAAEVLSKNDPPIALAKVDATQEKTLAERFGIQGFPTLMWFKNGVKSEYTGGRTKDTIIQWVTKKSGPPSTELACRDLKIKYFGDYYGFTPGSADEDVIRQREDKFKLSMQSKLPRLNKDHKFLIAYYGPTDNSLYTEAHVAYADAEDKINFVHLPQNCLGEILITEDKPQIVFFRDFKKLKNDEHYKEDDKGEDIHVYTGTPDKDQLMNFVKPLMVPTIFEFSEDQIEAIFGNQQNTIILFKDPADAAADSYFKTYAQAAETHKGKILFSYGGISEGIQERLAEFMGVVKDDLPTIRVIMPAEMKKYQYPGKINDITVESVGTFVQDVLDGKLKPHLKSEKPVDNTGKPVSVVVGENFAEIVKDETKDVLVKYYAPWCGHCKKLAPIWDELGEFYKDNENMVIAKFDATANEAEGVEIRGYPTLIFYPKNNKAGVDYSGERELQNFKDWLAENSPVLKGTDSSHETSEL